MDIIGFYETVFICMRYVMVGRSGRNLVLQRIWMLRTHSTLQSVQLPVSFLECVRDYILTMYEYFDLHVLD